MNACQNKQRKLNLCGLCELCESKLKNPDNRACPVKSESHLTGIDPACPVKCEAYLTGV